LNWPLWRILIGFSYILLYYNYYCHVLTCLLSLSLYLVVPLIIYIYIYICIAMMTFQAQTCV
jgi:hypothetical protein